MTLRIAAEDKTVSEQNKFVSNHDVKSGGGGSELNVTMTLIFPIIVWTCPLTSSVVTVLLGMKIIISLELRRIFRD